MPRSQEEYARIRAEAQDKIIGTAIGVFSKKGFSGTSISDIAAEAGISNGLLYRYFKSKQDLFDQIIDLAIGGLAAFTQLARQSSTPKETVGALCREMIDSLEDEDGMRLNLMITRGLLSKDSHAFAKILTADEALIAALSGLIEAGQRQGEFAAGDSRTKVYLLMSTIQGMVLMKSIFGGKFKPPTAMDLMSPLVNGSKGASDARD